MAVPPPTATHSVGAGPESVEHAVLVRFEWHGTLVPLAARAAAHQVKVCRRPVEQPGQEIILTCQLFSLASC